MQMTRQRLFSAITRSIMVLLFTAFLPACDGGLFGTGDGSTIEIDADNSVNAPGGLDNGSGTSDQDGMTETPVEGGDQASTDGIFPKLGFDNLVVSTGNSQPLVKLVNTTSISLNIVNNTTTLFDNAIAPGNSSKSIAVPVTTRSLKIIPGARLEDTLFEISPLNIAAFSATTLVARNAMPDTGTGTVGLTDSGIDVVPLRTAAAIDDTNLALVRIIQSVPLDINDSDADFILVPKGDSPGPAESRFPATSFSRALSADYQTMGAGTYVLEDSLERFDPSPVVLSGGKVYTLIIVSKNSPVLRVETDSEQTP